MVGIIEFYNEVRGRNSLPTSLMIKSDSERILSKRGFDRMLGESTHIYCEYKDIDSRIKTAWMKSTILLGLCEDDMTDEEKKELCFINNIIIDGYKEDTINDIGKYRKIDHVSENCLNKLVIVIFGIAYGIVSEDKLDRLIDMSNIYDTIIGNNSMQMLMSIVNIS